MTARPLVLMISLFSSNSIHVGIPEIQGGVGVIDYFTVSFHSIGSVV